MITYEEMLKVVVNDYVEQGVDARPWQEVYDHMLDWLKRGYMPRAFVDDCYDAIMDGRPVAYSYSPGEFYNCLYPLKGSKMNREEMNAMIAKAAKNPTFAPPSAEGESNG